MLGRYLQSDSVNVTYMLFWLFSFPAAVVFSHTNSAPHLHPKHRHATTSPSVALSRNYVMDATPIEETKVAPVDAAPPNE